MYCQHSGFREEPFGVSPDVRFLFPTAQHTEAMASLYYVVSQRRGLAVLIAAPGLGKTSLLVNLAERIGAVNPSSPLVRIDDPHEAHAESEIIVDLFLHLVQAIFRRQNLNA